MKYIKKYNELSYSVNESSIPRRETQELENLVKGGLVDLFEDEKEQRFFVSVAGTKSKYGTIIDISFSLDSSIGYDELDMERMTRWINHLMDLNNLVSGYFNKEAILCEFEFFGKGAIGKKNGRTLEVEDVTNQFEMALKDIDLEFYTTPNKLASHKTTPISFKFLVK